MSIKSLKPQDLDSHELSFGCDLMKQANQLFDLLEIFADFIKQFPTKDVLEQNIQEGFRDYSLFMALQSQNPNLKLVPTTIIELIWVSHLLRNEVYTQDCRNHFKQIIYRPTEYENRTKLFKETAKAWKEKYKFPYMQSVPKNIRADTEWIRIQASHVVEDCQWLETLIRLRPDYRDSDFLQRQKEYYQKVLYIWAHNGNQQTSGPHIGIDIFWHSHILSPTYAEDCEKLVGRVPSHHPKTEIPYKKAQQSLLQKLSRPLTRAKTPLCPPAPEQMEDQTKLDLLFVKTFGVHMSFSLVEVDQTAKDPFDERMPKEIFNLILNNLDFQDLISTGGVNKKWRTSVENSSRWRAIYTSPTVQESWQNSWETPPAKLIAPTEAAQSKYDHRLFMPLCLELYHFFWIQSGTSQSKSQWYKETNGLVAALAPPMMCDEPFEMCVICPEEFLLPTDPIDTDSLDEDLPVAR